MMWSERHGNEVYVFWNGELVYKRWLDERGNKRQASLLTNAGWPSVWIVPPAEMKPRGQGAHLVTRRQC